MRIKTYEIQQYSEPELVILQLFWYAVVKLHKLPVVREIYLLVLVFC
jgi:hypothetical protein